MIQCSECEFCTREPNGNVTFRCDPLSTIKEHECLAKWQLLRLAEVSSKLDRIVSAYETTAQMYQRLAPLQEKMFRHMEREIEAADESEKWKSADDDDDEWDTDFDDEDEGDERRR